MEARIQRRLASVARRTAWLRLGWSLALLWVVAALLGVGLLAAARTGVAVPRSAIWFLLGLTFLGAVAVWSLISARARDLKRTATRVERRFPGLKQSLLTATEIIPQHADGSYGYLQRGVISEAIRHDIAHRWRSLVSPTQLSLAWMCNVPALAALSLVAMALWKAPSMPGFAAASLPDSRTSSLPSITPGNTEVERGSGLLVTARFDAQLPDEIELVSQVNGENETRMSMRRSLNDPIFAAYLVDIQQPLRYRIEYDGATTPAYEVAVFEYPALVRADASLEYPVYTQLEKRTIVDTRRVSAPVGSQLTWELWLNKLVASASLIDKDGEEPPIELTQQSELEPLYTAHITLDATRSWLVRLVDAEGRENQTELTLKATALPNKEVDIKLTSGGDAQVSPLEEMEVAAKISDDFSVVRAGLAYQLAGSDAVEVEAPGAASAKRLELAELIDFESLGTSPGQLLSYYFWAEDLDQDGQPRQVFSDIYFAEVRPFDEIYRQGQQPTEAQQQQQQQQQQQGNQETEELLALQKQIMVGSWNVMRSATAAALPEKARDDLQLLSESQASALELLAEKAAEADVPGAERIIAAAAENMQSSMKWLDAAASSLRKSDLNQALAPQQAAYQELLRLQSAEHEVVRTQSSQSSQRGSSARQQQIDQLDLKQQENRYQEERLAQDQQEEQQSELRQVISRLRELSARQEDINKQLREIEAALQAADSEQQRAELENQLQRLREQQQQMLQDADELQERLESQTDESMQQTQSQMEQVRNSLQQSSEALRQGETSQSLAAGTRAEQELNELQDDVRQQAANQFSEDMQNMRSQAQALEQRQDEIVEQMSRNRAENVSPVAIIGRRASTPQTTCGPNKPV